MRRNRMLARMLTLLLVGLVGAFFYLTGCSSSGHDSHESIDGLTDLRTYIQGLDGQLTSDQQRSLTAKLDDADDAYSDGNPCGAAGYLGEYLDACQDLRGGDLTKLAEDLFNRGWMIRSDLLVALSEPCP